MFWMTNINLSDVSRTHFNFGFCLEVPLKWCVDVLSAWEVRKHYRVFPYLIVIWFVVTKRPSLTDDSFLCFTSALVNGFHLSAKFRVLRVEVLVSS